MMDAEESQIEEMVDPTWLALRWNVSPRTILREIERGNIRAHKIGRQLRIPASEAAAYLARVARP